MATEVDICNLAIANLGGTASVTSISPPDGSAAAAHCSRFYPIARDAALERHTWGFASRRTSLALHSEDPPGGWAYRYVWPNLGIRIARLIDPARDREDIDIPYAVETAADGTKTILCDVEYAEVLYVFQQTDTSKFSPLFVTSLSFLLASYISGPATKSAEKRQEMLKAYELELSKAMQASGNGQSSKARTNYVPGSVAAR